MNKLIYITSLEFPPNFANQIQVYTMAKNFNKLLGSRFTLVCSADNTPNHELSCHVPRGYKVLSKFLGIYFFFFWMPIYFILNKLHSEPIILYFKDTRLAAFAVFWKHFFKKTKVVIESHIPFPSRLQSYAFSRADRVVTITQSMVDILKDEYKVPENKTVLVADGIDLEQFDLKISQKDARIKLGLPLNKEIILYSGSVGFYGWKGEDVFIDAAKYFNDEYIFVVLGGSKEDAEKATGGNISENVMCVGRKPHSLVPLYLKASDILVLPNKSGNKWSDELTSPLKLFEYMASGVPVVASDLKSIREVLNTSNSLLIEPNDPIALSDGIKMIISDRVLSSNIAQKARKDVEKYQWKDRVNIVIKDL